MKTNRKILIIGTLPVILFMAIAFVGCYPDSRRGEFVLKNYVTCYCISRDFQVFMDRFHPDGDKPDMFVISLRGGDFVTPLSKGEDAILFGELAQKYGDTSYREVVEFVGPVWIPDRLFFSESIDDITVTCDQDVDERHPAGSSLNDLFLFFSGSPDEYIKNGYKPLDIDEEAFLEKIDPRFKEYVKPFFQKLQSSSEPIYGVMSEIDFSKYALMGNSQIPANLAPIALFTWIDPPEDIAEYPLKVEIEFADGVKKTATITDPYQVSEW